MNTMNAFATMLIAVVGLGSAPSPSPDLLAPTLSTTVSVDGSCCEKELTRARELHETGQWKEAHRAYREVARRQAAEGEYAGDTLWEAAQLSYSQGRYLRAARELDRVAEIAAEFGRPSMQARALFEAAVLYHRYVDGRDGVAHDRLVQLERILPSPDVSDEVREMVEGRTLGSGIVS
jgi:tetratricopeptide (TPR) repeat protein